MRQAKPRPIHKWTALKLEHLDHYLQAYVKAASRARERHYIDAFAGCGECVLIDNGFPVMGSPWRALYAIPSFTQYHFVEKKAGLAAHLRKTLSDRGFENAHAYLGDCNLVLPAEVLPRVPHDVPSFAFLDPTGLQLHWKTIEKLAGHRTGLRMELLILYPYDMAINRLFGLALASDVLNNTLTRFFGSDSWERQYRESVRAGEDPHRRRERFLALYTSVIKGLGYRYVEAYGPLYSGHRPLYNVIFAGDHPIGAKIMNDVWGKLRFVPGEIGYVPVKRPGVGSRISGKRQHDGS